MISYQTESLYKKCNNHCLVNIR
uniref:Uncharacterized protein n=1 Tax=Anguilla anguilla TaxID=7936 RepID=A0A0E9UXS0_ANGAN